MLLLLNLVGVAGLVLAGRVGDARGIRPSAVGWFVGATVLLSAWIARVFPVDHPGHRPGAGLRHRERRPRRPGRPAVTGALVTVNLAHPWGFSFFAVVALLAVVAMALSPRGLEDESTRSPQAGEVPLPRR